MAPDPESSLPTEADTTHLASPGRPKAEGRRPNPGPRTAGSSPHRSRPTPRAWLGERVLFGPGRHGPHAKADYLARAEWGSKALAK